ncbi:type I-E CRISPR-associated protein Cas6/Cse3/CasE [Gordonia aichiensis]|uniref:type I-E CRISPR-associated protein Cas6/Cse3/CasE n=1 Tax=Gordonia aichiensis TaxID=36820 RepID=UPI00326555D6
MYMSRIALNRRRRGAVKLLGNRHAMHAAVMSSFPPGTPTDTAEGRVLWRIDRRDEGTELLIVSPAKPCLTHIVEQAGWPDSVWETRVYTDFLARIRSEHEYVFRFTGNPTHRMTGADGRKQIVGHVTNEQQRNWFLDKIADHGFVVVSGQGHSMGDDAAGEEELVLRERDTAVFSRQSRRVTLVTAAFEGRVRVTDVDRARHALTHGIGRAKGYGCGLLTLMPVD